MKWRYNRIRNTLWSELELWAELGISDDLCEYNGYQIVYISTQTSNIAQADLSGLLFTTHLFP